MPAGQPAGLYDLAADPHEWTSLADDPRHKATLDAMRKALADWEERTGDRGCTPEPMAMCDAEMKLYLAAGAKKDRDDDLRRNFEHNKKWASEGM